MMAEPLAVSKGTWMRIENGDPTVAFGMYAMALHVLGFGDALLEVACPVRDDHGLLLDAGCVPKRVCVRREPGSQ
jgi:hypothetical protein